MIAVVHIAGWYTIMALVHGVVQLVYNRRFGRSDPNYAEAWFIGLLWFPVMVWVLGERAIIAIKSRKDKALPNAQG